MYTQPLQAAIVIKTHPALTHAPKEMGLGVRLVQAS